jgi:hypothetical protein
MIESLSSGRAATLSRDGYRMIAGTGACRSLCSAGPAERGQIFNASNEIAPMPNIKTPTA